MEQICTHTRRSNMRVTCLITVSVGVGFVRALFIDLFDVFIKFVI